MNNAPATNLGPAEHSYRGYCCGPSLFWPLVLIVVGSFYLLDNLGMLPYYLHLERFWPVVLIALGVWMLVRRVVNTPR